MEKEICARVKARLETRPRELTDLEEWLFVVVNTAKSIIDNTSRQDLDVVLRLADCGSTGQMQREFDFIQGRFGREGFTQRYSPAYRYLCSLAANFPDRTLSDRDRERIREYGAVETYLLYGI